MHADEMVLAETALSLVPRVGKTSPDPQWNDALDSVAIPAAPVFDIDTST